MSATPSLGYVPGGGWSSKPLVFSAIERLLYKTRLF